MNEARVDFTRLANLSGEPTDPEVSLVQPGLCYRPGTLGIINSGPVELAVRAADFLE